MCRTGRVFRPEVDGQALTLRVIGARYHNAIFEDEETGSWWWQATGEAAIGPLLGKGMENVPCELMTLDEWLALHPGSDVLQPDPAIGGRYELFDFHTVDERKPSRDDERFAAGEMREWVVVLRAGGAARAYPWFHLEDVRLIQDELGGVPVALFLREDGVTFRAWDRRLGEATLTLRIDEEWDTLADAASGTIFGFDGTVVYGHLEGEGALAPLRASQEYWHSAERFVPGLDRYAVPGGGRPAPGGGPALGGDAGDEGARGGGGG